MASKNKPQKKKAPPEFLEGPKARRNFDDAMKTLFRAPKPKKGKD